MGTVDVLTSEKTLQLLNETIVSGLVNEDNELIFTKQDGTEINAGVVGNSVDTSGLRAQSNAEIDIVASDAEGTVETVNINDDGSDSSTWANRLVYMWVPVAGTAHKTTYLNEYGEFRAIPAKTTTVAARWFTKASNADPAHDANTPIMELQDDPVTRTSLRGWLPDGTTVRKGIKMADVIVLGPTDTVPAGLPAGTVILRT